MSSGTSLRSHCPPKAVPARLQSLCLATCRDSAVRVCGVPMSVLCELQVRLARAGGEKQARRIAPVPCKAPETHHSGVGGPAAGASSAWLTLTPPARRKRQARRERAGDGGLNLSSCCTPPRRPFTSRLFQWTGVPPADPRIVCSRRRSPAPSGHIAPDPHFRPLSHARPSTTICATGP